MSSELDLSECEQEPLCTLAFIQSHGCLIAFGMDQVVSHVSANVETLLGVGADQVLKRELKQSLPNGEFIGARASSS